ncbi:MAG: tetratricopeptide repeat protein [Candidatus Latescibacteria bacterium]|nr:tetratricopeptide repeat protein [Candidatus Latescibacterota bacterium]
MARRHLVLIFFVALVLRLGYLLEMHASPYFSVLVLDAEEYAFLGEAIAKGNWAAGVGATYVHGLLYPVILALFNLVGAGHTAVRVFQALLGAGSCALIYQVAQAVFPRPTPLLAGLFGAGYWLLIFYTGELLTTTLSVFLELLLVTLVLRHARRPSSGMAAGAGLVLGLLTVTHNTAFFQFPVVAWGLWRGSSSHGRGRRLWLAAALGLALVLVPFILRNLLVQGSLLPAQGAWSLYLGTNADADGTPYARQGLDWQRLETLPYQAGMAASASEKARFYLEASARFVLEHPGAYLGLLYHKFRLFWNAFEVPISEDLAYYQTHSRLHRLLILDFGLLAPLALVGLVWGWRRRWQCPFLAGLVLSHLAAGMAFTVCARYRLPALPLLLPFAAEGVRRGVAILRRRQPRRSAVLLASLGAAMALVHTGVNPREVNPVRSAWLQGHVLMRQGQYARGEEAFLRGLDETGPDPDIYNSLGAAREWLGREPEAEAAYLEALRLAPEHSRPRLNLGKLYLKQARLGEAETALRSALRDDPRPGTQYEGRVLLGQVLRRVGREAEARAVLAQAAQLAPRGTAP